MLPRRLLGARVQRGTSAATIDDPTVDEPTTGGRGWLTANRHIARLALDGVATFVAGDGSHVTVDLDRRADPLRTEQLLYGPVAGLVLGQQGRFALHASTVEVDGVAISVAGRGGAGKSTTALELCRRSHRLIADDVSPFDAGATAEVVVRPFGRPVHLWPDTANALGVDLPTNQRLMRSGKVVVPPPPLAETVAVRAVVVVAAATNATTVTTSRMEAGAALPTIAAYLYRGATTRRIWPAEAFRWAALVAARVPVLQLLRPYHAWTVGEVADKVQEAAAGAHGLAALP